MKKIQRHTKIRANKVGERQRLNLIFYAYLAYKADIFSKCPNFFGLEVEENNLCIWQQRQFWREKHLRHAVDCEIQSQGID